MRPAPELDVGCVRLTFDSFQEIQKLSPMQAALRFIPEIVIGMVLSVLTGFMVHRARADYLVVSLRS